MGKKKLRCQAARYKKLQCEQKKETMTQCNELLLSVTLDWLRNCQTSSYAGLKP